jgi:predicted metalloenzyme YecM
MHLHDILGDYVAFYALQKRRLGALGIDIHGLALSHLAFRTDSWDEYLLVRERLEAQAHANVENQWNGRPISKIVLREPLEVEPGLSVKLIELIPPPHQATYKMGLEHVGIVIGDGLERFALSHQDAMTGRQFQTEECRPFYISFDDHTNVKFYVESLMDVCIAEGRRFDGFHHA